MAVGEDFPFDELKDFVSDLLVCRLIERSIYANVMEGHACNP